MRVNLILDRLKNQHRLLQALAVLIVFILALGLSYSPWGGQLDQFLFDQQVSLSRQYFPQPVKIDPILIGLDEKFVDSVDEPVALHHQYLARTMEIASAAGAKVIGLDIALPEKRFESLALRSDPELDLHQRLLRGMLSATSQSKLVTAKVFDRDAHRYRDLQLDYAAVLENQEGEFHGVASAHLCDDSDGKIRRFPDQYCQPDQQAFGLASEIAAAYGVRANWHGLINYRLGPSLSYRSMQTILEMDAAHDEIGLRHLFEGKIVLIGSTQEYVDLLPLPVKMAAWLPQEHRVPGLLAHAQILRSILNQGLIQNVAVWQVWVLCAVGALFLMGRRIAFKLSLAGVALVALGLLSFLLFLQNMYLDIVPAIFAVCLACTASVSWQAWRHFVDKQKLSKAFTGRVSPQVMEAIMHGEVGAMQTSRRDKVCVLFSDVRNFTTMCEHMPAEQVVTLLNQYFSLMVLEIHRYGGTVDKFIGDGLMAFFGAPNALKDPERQALLAARAMLKALQTFNSEIQQQGFQEWKIGIGLHSGEAVIGVLGSEERHEYTAIGDVVNTAARLESISKNLNYPIIVSDVVAQAVGDDPLLVALQEQALKGRSALAVFGSPE